MDRQRKIEERTRLLREHRISLAGLARKLGKHPSTIARWGRDGLGGVRLETYLLGGRRFTTKEAGVRFLERLNAAATDSPPSEPAARRDAAIERAERELDRLDERRRSPEGGSAS